jgi:hypothetical protein
MSGRERLILDLVQIAEAPLYGVTHTPHPWT